MQGKIRFAPSPTGYLHEGHLLSALYVWASAKKWNLKILLRIEDHDKSRARDEYINSIFKDLSWFGFKWDEQSIQSSRQNIYEQAFQKLKKQDLIYSCYCSRKQLEEENPKSKTGEIIYQKKCLLKKLRTNEHAHNIRVKIPNKVIEWNDLRLGTFYENPQNQCGDFPIKDRDNQWTYQFAVCVDDIDEQITHIVRGEDIRNSTARQIALMNLLGSTSRPLYFHHPLITDPYGKKLSKREKSHSLNQDILAGGTPEIIIGKTLFDAQLQSQNNPISLNDAICLIEAKI